MALQIWLPLTKDLRQQGLSNGTITNNGAIFNSAGKLGGCYYFNNNYVWLPVDYSSFDTKFSVAFWYKIDTAFSGNRHLVCLCNQYGWAQLKFTCAATSNNTLTFNIGNGSTCSQALSTPQIIGSWQHICFTFNNKVAKVYVNGIQTGTATYSINPNWSGTTKMGIGGAPDGHECATTLSLNDVRIYNHCLSEMEVKKLAKGLVLHYPLSDKYIEGTTNLASTSVGGWDNSGSSSRNTNDTSILNKPTSGPTASSIVTTQGNCAFTCATTNTNHPSKTLTFSLWYWQSGPQDTSTVYIRSSKTDGNVGNFEYNGSALPNTWPKEKWIYLTKTITTASDATTFYICTYINPKDSKRAFNGWQIEEKDHATPWTAPGTTRAASTTEYDISGFCNNGTRSGTFSWSGDVPSGGLYPVSTYFNGSSYITSDASILGGAQEFTLAAWFKIPVLDNLWHRIIAVGPHTRTQIDISSQTTFSSFPNHLRFLISPTGSSNNIVYIYSSNSLVADTWYHVAGTFLNNELKLYINGELDPATTLYQYTGSQSVITTMPTITYTDALPFIIGTAQKSSDYLTGNICDARVYATALSANDIKSLYQNEALVDSNGTVHGAIR